MKTITIQDLNGLSLKELDMIEQAARLAYAANPFYGVRMILTDKEVFMSLNGDDTETTSPKQWSMAIAEIIKPMSTNDLGFNFYLADLRGKTL
jgi:hypothetical protein